MAEELGVIRIFRYNPATDSEPHYDTFEGVPYQGRTVMDVIRYVFENRDSTLAYRYSCRLGLCMVCRMKMNGHSILACKKLAEPDMTIDPPGTGRIIKDLMTTLDGDQEGSEV